MISDAAARAEALRADRSFIVQAPAGSGKTGLLVYRMLTLLATVEQPQQVLAITFTRKATSEMRQRVLELLQMAEHGQAGEDVFEQQGIQLANAVLAQDLKCNWNLLNTPHQLQILTIDSFCAKLTASMPWLSQLGDRPRTTDKADPHYAAAVEHLLSELLSDSSALSVALQTVLLELDYNYNKARLLFISMLAKRDQWLRHLLHNDLPSLRFALESTWQGIVNEQLKQLNQLLPENTRQTLVELASSAAANLAAETNGNPSPLAVFASFDGTPRALTVDHWKALRHMLLVGDGKSFRKQVNKKIGFPTSATGAKKKIKMILGQFADDEELRTALYATDYLPAAQFTDQDWHQLMALELVLKSLAAQLQLRFRAVGECDHSEVNQRANLALQELDNPTDLSLRLDYQLQHILVDEFQDTSYGQIELLKRLTAGWSASGDNSPRTLFLVGDPMQSVYRFREADVSLFLRVTDNHHTRVFDNIVINSLALTENFRSSVSLVNWFNQTFASSFPACNNVLTGAISYADTSSNKCAHQPCVDYALARDKLQEAELVTAAVQQALQELPNDNSKVAILVRSRSVLDALLPSLQAAGIAYAGVDIQPLKDQQAVIDILALCKAICREDDRVSWLALLRGPWCGLTLAEIKQVVDRQDQTIWQQLLDTDTSQTGADGDSMQRLARFVRLMQNALAQRQQVELSSLIRWTWQALGGEQTLYGANRADVEAVFKLIESLQKGGDLASVRDLDNALQGLYAQPNQLNPQSVARVVVSTIHKAKGLQYDTVILPGLGSPGRADDKEILMWAEHQNSSGEPALLLAPIRLQQGLGGHYDYLRELEKQRSSNEAIRLMYVACTRSERRLVLVGRAGVNDNTQQAKPPRKGSLLATIWNSVADRFDFPQTTSQLEPSEKTYSQILSRIPAQHDELRAKSVQWLAVEQLASQAQEPAIENEVIEYDWATEVATGVGIVLHDWLQFTGSSVLTVSIDEDLRQRWRTELAALRVPDEKVEYALKRLVKAVTNIQSDFAAHFLFQDYPEQHNEYALAALEDGVVNTYRIDRTFIDDSNIRWIVDYKSTDTRNKDVDTFIDQQTAIRHRPQLEKYGALMSKLDSRHIKLAVYFPVLSKIRSWDYKN